MTEITDTQQEKFILFLFLVVVVLGSLKIFGGDNLAPSRKVKPQLEHKQL